MSMCPFTLKNQKKKSKARKEESDEEESSDDTSQVKGCFNFFPKDHRFQTQSSNMAETMKSHGPTTRYTVTTKNATTPPKNTDTTKNTTSAQTTISPKSTTFAKNTTTTENTPTTKNIAESANRRPLANGRVYHFNVIYNHARCPLSVTADTELALAWTQWAVEKLQLTGLVNSYYHDRDCVRGQGLLQELARVIAGSEVTLVVLTPGFVRDCWPRYWFFSCFKSLFSSLDQSPATSTTSSTASLSPRYSPSRTQATTSSGYSSPRLSAYSSSYSSVYSTSGSSSPRTPPGGVSSPCSVVVVALGLGAGDLPAGLRPEDVLFFSKDWRDDLDAWQRLQGSVTSALVKDSAATGGGDDEDLKIQLEQPRSPRSSDNESGGSQERDGASRKVSPRAGEVSSAGNFSSRRREDKADVTGDTSVGKTYGTSNGATSSRSKEGRSDVTHNGSVTRNGSYRHSYPSFTTDSDTKTGSGSSSFAKSQSNLTTDKTKSEKESSYKLSPRLQGSSSQSLKLTTTALNVHGVFHTHESISTSQEEPSLSRHVQIAPGEKSRVEKLPAIEKSAMRIEEGPRATLVLSLDSTLRQSAREGPPSQLFGAEGVDVKTPSCDSTIARSRVVDSNISTSSTKEQQVSREVPRPESKSEIVHTTSQGDGDVETAVLDRLGQAGIRRESLTNTPITRVFVKGNTVSVDHIYPSTPDRSQNQSTSDALKRSTEGSREQTLNAGFDNRSEASKTRYVNSSGQTKQLSERQPGEKGSSNTTQSQAYPLQSSEREVFHSAGRSSVLESSMGTAAATGARDVPDSGSITSKTLVSNSHSETTTYSPSGVPKKSTDASHQVVSNQSHSRLEARELQGTRDEDDVDHGFQDVQTTVTTTPSTLGRNNIAETINNRHQPQNHSPRTQSSTQSSPTTGQHRDSLPISSSTVSKPATNDPHHLHDSVKLAIIEPKIATTEADPVSSDYHHHHITSIEEDHDYSLSDYLATSLTTSDYGTMSPRNDLSGSGHGDSGFLSGGLSPRGENVSPRTNTSKSSRDRGEAGAFTEVKKMEASKSSALKTDSSLTNNQKTRAENGMTSDAFVVRTSSRQGGTSQSGGHNNNSKEKFAIQNTATSSHTLPHLQTQSIKNRPQETEMLTSKMKTQSLENNPQEPEMLASKMKTQPLENNPQQSKMLASKTDIATFTSTSASYDSGRRFNRESTITTKHGEVNTARREKNEGHLTARASRSGSDLDASHGLERRDSWIYDDVDKGRTLAEMLFPLYRIMCYVLSRPEMPFF